MANDPAFLFYSDNFMSGTMFFTDEQAGKYIRLLCAQHLTGHLSEKHMLKICGTYDEDIWSKFQKDENGLYYQHRLELEINRRKKYSDSRRNNRMSAENQQETKKNKSQKKKNISKSYVKHMGNGDGNEIVIEDKGVQGEKPKELINPHPFSNSFLDHWERWIEYKSDEWGFKYKKIKTEQSTFNILLKLSNNSEQSAIEIIDQSIANKWKGFYAIKNDNSTSGKSDQKFGRVPASSITKYLNRPPLTVERGTGTD